jgi:tubulin-specific chaperone D
VKDLEPVLFFLVVLRKSSTISWELRYVYLLWLSIIILVPFDLETIDSNVARDIIDKDFVSASSSQVGKVALQDVIIHVCKYYLNSATKTQEAASTILAKLFSRPDIQKTNLLRTYLKWAMQTIEKIQEDMF